MMGLRHFAKGFICSGVFLVAAVRKTESECVCAQFSLEEKPVESALEAVRGFLAVHNPTNFVFYLIWPRPRPTSVVVADEMPTSDERNYLEVPQQGVALCSVWFNISGAPAPRLIRNVDICYNSKEWWKQGIFGGSASINAESLVRPDGEAVEEQSGLMYEKQPRHNPYFHPMGFVVPSPAAHGEESRQTENPAQKKKEDGEASRNSQGVRR